MRFVSERYRHIYAARGLSDWQRIASRRAVYMPGQKVMYMINAKAASSTLRDMMIGLGRRIASEQGQEAGAVLRGVAHWQPLVQSFTNPDVYRFTVVRHPVSRAVSAFTNLFVDRRNGFKWRHIPYLGRTGLKFGDRSPENFDRFLDYIEEVRAESDMFCDVHLRLQTHNISARHIGYDRIGHFETLGEDIGKVMEEAGLAGVFDVGHLGWVNKSSAERNGHALGDDQLQRLYRLYEEDFDRFGYVLKP